MGLSFKNLLVCFGLFFVLNPALAETKNPNTAPRIIVSIKPLHAWVSAVTEGVTQPYLLLKNSDSVHSYSLKPSDARELSRADVVFITDKRMELYLQHSINNLATQAKILELSMSPGVRLLAQRKGGLFEKDDDEDSNIVNYNFHFWLDPENAVAATGYIAKVLSEVDPNNAAVYLQNARNYQKKLKQAERDIKAKLTNHRNINFIVFHDAYYYYEKRFGVSALGSVIIDPEHQAGARRIKMIRDKIKNLSAACVFTEPQFSPAIVKNILEGTKAKQGVLDPIGASLKPGPMSYIKLLNNITDSLLSCSLHNSQQLKMLIN